jgi:CubicO group peptidase (beta-lactamase class C family)
MQMKKLLLISCFFLHHYANAQTLDSSIIHKMEAAIENGTYPNTHSLLIAHNNKTIYEKYWSGRDKKEGVDLGVVKHGPDSLHECQSVTKSIVSACVGIALQQGKIKSIDQNVFDFFPEYAAQDTGLKTQITIKDLLTMTAGFEWNEEHFDRPNSEHMMDSASDPVGYVLSLPMVYKAGETFTYCGGAPQVLAAIIEKATGKRIDLFAKEYLFGPLGITNYKWTFANDNNDVIDAASGVYMRSRDMMTFGLMYLNNGRWNGKQIIPASWIKESTTPQTNTHNYYNDQYGFLWWIWKDSVLKKPISVAVGNGGQCIFIDKENNLVVVVTAGNYRMKTYSFELFEDFVYTALFKFNL